MRVSVRCLVILMRIVMKIRSKTGRVKRFLFLGLIAGVALPSAVFLFRSVVTACQIKTSQAMIIEKTEYSFDSIYSGQLRQALQCCVNQFVAKNSDFLTFDQQKLYEFLKNEFKVVKSFDCRLDNKSVLFVKIEGQKPFCFINKNQILSESDALFSSDLFQDFDCASLPNINIENFEQKVLEGVVSKELCEFVHKITDLHWQNFEINYVKPSEIRLYPKNTIIRCILLTGNKTFFDYDKISKAIQLSQKVASDKQIQKKLKYTSKKILELDLRFKSSIVARAESEVKEGGEYEEKVI